LRSELFVPFLEDKSTGLWLLPLLPPPQAHNGVHPIYNAAPSSGHAQRYDYKDLDQGIVHSSTGLPFSMVSDNGLPMTTLRTSTSATFNQDRTNLLNNHHRLGHITINRARSFNIDRISQLLLKMPTRKNHFIDAYRRFLATTGIKPQYIRTLRTDQGGEYTNHPM